MVGLCLQMASAFPRPCLPATFCFLQELEKLINEAIHIQIECLKELLQYLQDCILGARFAISNEGLTKE